MTQETVWMRYFGTEADLIDAVKDIDVHKFNDLCNKGIVTGYQYITRSVRTLQSGDLSEAQLRQVKRLASQIDKYYRNI